MTLGIPVRRWRAAFAFACMLALAPAAAQAQQSPAPAQQGYLGVQLHSLSREEAQARGVPDAGGAEITWVHADSPAAKVGLKRGDILTEADGKPIADAEQFLKLFASRAPGTVIRLGGLRDGEFVSGPVTLGAKPDPVAAAEAARQEGRKARIVPQLGHTSSVTSIAISPDGRTALSGGGVTDNTLRLWDLASGREIRKFEGHSDFVHSVAFSPDGKTALSGGTGAVTLGPGELILWDLASGREIRKFEGHTETVNSVAFAPDGKTALSGSADKTLRLWDLATGREIRKLEGHPAAVSSVAIAPDGKTALSAGGCEKYDAIEAWRCVKKSSLRLWDLASGREIRTFEGHSDQINSVAFSPDGKTALSASTYANPSDTHEFILWDLASGRKIRTFEGHSDNVNSVAIAPDGKTALSGSWDHTVRLWDSASGREIRKFEGHPSWVSSVVFSPDGKTALSGDGDVLGQGDHALRLWDLASGREIRKFEGHSAGVSSVAFAPDGSTALSGSDTLRLWDLASGREIGKFEGHSGWVDSVAFSPAGKTALSGGGDGALRLYDLASGREIKKFGEDWGRVGSVAFSPDGKTALSGNCDEKDGICTKGSMRLWDLASGREIKKFERHPGSVNSVAFSQDGKTALSGGNLDNNTMRLWDLAGGSEIEKFEGHIGAVNSVAFAPDGKTALSGSDDSTLKLWDLASGRLIRKFFGYPDGVNSVAIAPDGKTALSGGAGNTLRLWDLASGSEIRQFFGHSSWVNSVAIAPDGKTALSGSVDGTIRLWNLQTGGELVSLLASRDGGQLAITPKGFFTASQRDTDMLAIARGLEVTTIGQVHQSLFNPDLVREALAGDPDGEVARAAEVMNLEKVLDAGPPPAVAITLHEPGSRSSTDLVTVAARITDRGKGIGRIEWRLNGVTAGVSSVPAGTGPHYDVTQELALDPGENRIEVIAYEGRNLLASLPAQTAIVYDGPADTAKPRLHILAIGINAYEDKGWAEPGSGVVKAFPPLGLAVGDATAFAAEMEKAAAGLYGGVRIRTALDREATPANLDRIVREMAAEVSPRDTFVLYVAGHGYSLNGNYYMIPQDYQGGINPVALKARAIGQDRLQDWIANRIKAKKALILLDTCESGALTGGYTKSRVDAPASEAAVGRLHEATGRPVLTAAAAGKPAFRGLQRPRRVHLRADGGAARRRHQ